MADMRGKNILSRAAFLSSFNCSLAHAVSLSPHRASFFRVLKMNQNDLASDESAVIYFDHNIKSDMIASRIDDSYIQRL